MLRQCGGSGVERVFKITVHCFPVCLLKSRTFVWCWVQGSASCIPGQFSLCFIRSVPDVGL